MVVLKKIAFIGCGGINSWAIHNLHEVLKIFEKNEMFYIKLFDNDIIEEKNIKRKNQNFEIEDLMEQKAEVLAKKYGYDFENVFITEENISLLDTFDSIILGVDNHKIRRMVYNYALNKKKYVLDMRAQGTQMAYFVLNLDKDIKYYDEKFFNNKELMERKGSCQLTTDVEKDHFENGNKIIAFFGIYGIFLKHIRGENISTNEWRFVY